MFRKISDILSDHLGIIFTVLYFLNCYCIREIVVKSYANLFFKIFVIAFALISTTITLYSFFDNHKYHIIKIPPDSFLSKTCSLLSDIREKDGCTEEDAINHTARFYSRELNLKSEISKQFPNYDTRSDDIYNHLLSLDNIEKRMFVINLPLEYQKDILHRLIAEEKI